MILGWEKNKTCSEKGGGGGGDTRRQDFDKTESFFALYKTLFIYFIHNKNKLRKSSNLEY